MKSPIDTVRGRIVAYDERTGELLIRARYDDYITMTRREYKECLVQLVDNRPLSDKQRKMCYSLIREISNFTGQGMDSTKEFLKLKFIVENLEDTADKIFSLSNASMSLVCAFQRYLVRFIVDWDIPCSFPLLKYVDDIQDYLYYCTIKKRCCICGTPSDLHHVDRVGIGRNRNDIINEGMEVLPLCRTHHEQAHKIPDSEFFSVYHIDSGIKMDKTLCKIYRLK